jgi:hypothetical protein
MTASILRRLEFMGPRDKPEDDGRGTIKKGGEPCSPPPMLSQFERIA